MGCNASKAVAVEERVTKPPLASAGVVASVGDSNNQPASPPPQTQSISSNDEGTTGGNPSDTLRKPLPITSANNSSLAEEPKTEDSKQTQDATTEVAKPSTEEANGEGTPKDKKRNRAKTAERRARTANRARERTAVEDRRDHLQRAALERFRGVVRKLQQNKGLMKKLRRESDMAQKEAEAASEKELDDLCFSLSDEPEPEPDGPIPTMEEYLEQLRQKAPVVA